MPRSKNPRAYPHMYYKLTEAVAAGQEVTLSFPTKQTAKAKRLDYYGFRTALEAVRDDLYNVAVGITVTMELNPDTLEYDLTFQSRIDDAINSQIEQALNESMRSAGTIPSMHKPAPYPSDSVQPSTAQIADTLGIPTPEEEEDVNNQSVYKQYMPGGADKETES